MIEPRPDHERARGGPGPPAGPLDGVRVVELAQNIAVPYCGRLLAGMGADVVKVEPPGGDAMRGLGELAPGEGKAFAVSNPSKRGIVVDLGQPGAGPVVEALLRWADVVLVGFKRTDLARYRIDWDNARAINPRLVHLTHTAFGPEGPDADLGGYDVLVQARSGTGFIMNRSEDGLPTATRPAVNDVGAGMVSALGVVAALRQRDRTGEGQRVDTSLLGAALALGTPLINYFPILDAEGVAELNEDIALLRSAGADFDAQRAVYEDRVLPGAGAFRLYFRHYATADGIVSVAGLSPALKARFHAVTGVPEPDAGEPGGPGLDSVVAQAEEVFRSRSTAAWLAALRDAGVPASPYLHPYEAIEDEQARTNDYVVDIDHPAFGTYTTTGQPVSFGSSPAPHLGPSPGLGQHTCEVMSTIGIDADQTADLVAQGVLHTGPRRP